MDTPITTLISKGLNTPTIDEMIDNNDNNDNNDNVWEFLENVEEDYEDALNFITLYKRAYNDSKLIQTRILVSAHLNNVDEIFTPEDKKNTMLCELLTCDQAHKQIDSKIVLEKNKSMLEKCEKDCEKYQKKITNYHCYKEKAYNFLRQNKLMDIIDVSLLLNKHKMEDVAANTYIYIDTLYTKYISLSTNIIYVWFPFMRPRSYESDLKYYKQKLINNINFLGKLLIHFPSIKNYIINELKRIRHINYAYEAAKKLAIVQYKNNELTKKKPILNILNSNDTLNITNGLSTVTEQTNNTVTFTNDVLTLDKEASTDDALAFLGILFN
jgi:hypothetical protein